MSTNNRAADADADTIALLTKEEMLDFFTHSISPSSSQRAKLSVHLSANREVGKTADALKEPIALPEHAPTLSSHTISTSEHVRQLDIQGIVLGNETHRDGEPQRLGGLEDKFARANPKVQMGLDADLTHTNHAVMIEDCHAWRASMPISAGVRSVKTMEKFTEAGNEGGSIEESLGSCAIVHDT
jgi:insulysin